MGLEIQEIEFVGVERVEMDGKRLSPRPEVKEAIGQIKPGDLLMTFVGHDFSSMVVVRASGVEGDMIRGWIVPPAYMASDAVSLSRKHVAMAHDTENHVLRLVLDR